MFGLRKRSAFRHFFGMLFVVEEDVAADPADVGAFGAEAKMPHPGNISDLVEKFWTWHRGRRILSNG